MLVIDPVGYEIEVSADDSDNEIADRVVIIHALTEGEGGAVAAGVPPSGESFFALLVRLSVGQL